MGALSAAGDGLVQCLTHMERRGGVQFSEDCFSFSLTSIQMISIEFHISAACVPTSDCLIFLYLCICDFIVCVSVVAL